MADSTAVRPAQLQRERLNELWRVTGQEPSGGSLRRQLLFTVRRVLAAALRPQETFNAAVVQYINETAFERQRLEELVAECRDAIEATLRYRESLAARERRVETGMAAISAAHDELRMSVGVLQQATQLLQHEIARRPAAPTGDAEAAPPAPAAPHGDALGHKYVGFEEQFRGSPEAIRERLSTYVPIFAEASNVLDIGCGRGEFLSLLRERGISARGIDTNESMIQVCHENGLMADVAGALDFLRAQSRQSLGGLFAAQVVEHLEPSYLAELLDAAFLALRPGAPIVLETINPACWFAFFESYIRDITHVRPLHPDTLKYLLVATGFQRVDVRYRVPYPEHEKLQPLPPNAALGDAVETLNGNVRKINQLLFTYLDYAAVGYRP
jgi:O-antigen chain-terminating methyltransferase